MADTDSSTIRQDDELSDTALDQISGGLNPQSLAPAADVYLHHPPG